MSSGPGSWEHGIGESIGTGSDRTFTHHSTNPEPDGVNQPKSEDRRLIYELEIYHDAGNTKYYAIIREAKERLDERGDVVETVGREVIDKEVVEVDEGYVSPGHHSVESYEGAESLIHEKAKQLMEKHH